MKRVGIVVLVLMMLGLWQASTPRDAYACKCAPPPEPRDALEQSSSVFSGKVASVTTQESSDGLMQQAVTFDVISSWKGANQAQMVLRSGMNTDCGFNFEVGKRYLVYAYGDASNLGTGLCSRTKLLTVSGEDIAKLGPGKQPIANPAIQPTAQPTAPNEVQASFIPYVVPALAVVVILMVLFLVIFRRKSS